MRYVWADETVRPIAKRAAGCLTANLPHSRDLSIPLPLFGRRGWLARIEHPNVSGLALEFNNDFVACHGSGPVQAQSGAVEMVDRICFADGALAGRIQPLRPQTRSAVAFGNEIESASVRGPERHAVGSGAMGDLNPILLAGRLRGTIGGDESGGASSANIRRESDPAAIGRDGAGEQAVFRVLQILHLLARGEVQHVNSGLLGIVGHQQPAAIWKPGANRTTIHADLPRQAARGWQFHKEILVADGLAIHHLRAVRADSGP